MSIQIFRYTIQPGRVLVTAKLSSLIMQLIVLTDLVGLESRQVSVGMVCFCSDIWDLS